MQKDITVKKVQLLLQCTTSKCEGFARYFGYRDDITMTEMKKRTDKHRCTICKQSMSIISGKFELSEQC